MRRNFSHHNRFPGYYRQDYLDALRGDMSINEVARQAGTNLETTQRVFKGTASQKKAWPVGLYLKADWTLLHELGLSLDEILSLHRAALNGKLEVRAVLGRRVGAATPPKERRNLYSNGR